VDLIDYDVDLGFLETSANKIDLAKANSSSQLLNVRQARSDNIPADIDNTSRIETSQQEPLSVGRSAPIPLFDRSTKPTKMNNVGDNHNVRANGDISRLSNHLNTGTKTINEASPGRYTNGHGVMHKSISNTGPPPISDRSKRPTDQVNISNQEIASQRSKLEDELHSVVLLQEKKASEAQALADLMRKKKKLEEDLTTITQKRNM